MTFIHQQQAKTQKLNLLVVRADARTNEWTFKGEVWKEIDTLIASTITDTVERVREVVEEHFKGLVHIPAPELTKEAILSRLNTITSEDTTV